jgi:hypothetical protein
MKAQNVLTLVEKDLRMSRRVVAISLAIWALPMVLAAAFMAANDPCGYSGPPLMRIIGVGGGYSFYLTFLMMPAVVGYILTAEGTDRSAAFLAYMPFSRIESLAGKAISATMMTMLFIGLNALLMAIPLVTELSSTWVDVRTITELLYILTFILSFEVFVSGATWAAAMCVRSAAIATVVGLGLPFSLLVYQAAYHGISFAALRSQFVPWLVLGVIFFIIGAVVFMKRRPEA